MAFQPLCIAPNSQFNGHPLPPSASPQYYNTGWRTAAVATSVWVEADHDQLLCLWHLEWYTLNKPNESKSQFHQRCSETSLKTYSILFFSFNTQLQSLAGHNRKQTKERPCNLRKAATSLAVYDHPWRRGSANSVRIKPSFGTANVCFTNQA